MREAGAPYRGEAGMRLEQETEMRHIQETGMSHTQEAGMHHMQAAEVRPRGKMAGSMYMGTMRRYWSCRGR